VKNSYSEKDFSRVQVSPYFFNIEEYFQKSDLIICRAGATTIAELIAAKKASLLIPFAKAADNHQFFNALELEKAGGAEIILESEFSAQKLAGKIVAFFTNKETITQMENNLTKFETGIAADKIIEICFELIKNNETRS
jgi:UDP-N-acetylglucosamine--N-acetylmuramyl-(pentapeptide) pyrophosphoryl-undecaprenol N-acetylglucosamine transferase